LKPFHLPISRSFTLGFLIPLLALVTLLTVGTRSGSPWRLNLDTPRGSLGLGERFSSVTHDEVERLDSYSGTWERYGLTLGPGKKGYARFRFSGINGNELLIRVWAYDYGDCRIRWWPANEDSISARVLSPGGLVVGRGFRIDPPSGVNAIIFEVAGTNRTPLPQLLLDRISVSSSQHRPLKGWNLAWWLWGTCTFFWWSFAAKRKWWRPEGGIILWGAALVVVIVGGSIRLNLLSFLNTVPLEPDVIMYRLYADRLQWFNRECGFFSASFGEREPLWIAVLQLWQGWVGNGDFAIRLLTALLSIAVIALTGVFLWMWLPERGWVVVGMLMVSLNPSLIEEACRGLRSEAMTIGFIVFLLLSFPVGSRRFRPIPAGCMVGLWGLLRGPAIGIAFGVWAGLWLGKIIFGFRNAPPWLPLGYSFPRILLSATVALCFVMPHLYGFHKRYGDWQWPSYGYARWNANMEFPDRLGTPGFPTVAEFKKNPYAGPPISYSKYLFDLHTPAQILAYQLLGWVELLGSQVLGFSTTRVPLFIQLVEGRINGIQYLIGPSIVAAFVIGLITLISWCRLIFDRKLWWAPPMILWGTFYAAFLYHLRLVEPMRHTAHVYPLLVLVTLWGVRWLFKSASATSLISRIKTLRMC